MNLKCLTRLFTTKEWRRHKRRRLFEELFEELKKERNDQNFSGIKATKYTYENVCRELASIYDYNPFLDKSYKINKIRNKFDNYQDQVIDSLNIKIIRNSPILKYIIQRKGNFTVEVSGKEAGKNFSFKYTQTVKNSQLK